jgi:hypothetical protein
MADGVVEFTPWPKIARLNKPVVVTEKIDGTNAAIGVREIPEGDVQEFETVVAQGGGLPPLAVRAQSRKRFITPADDNYGFAKWAYDNAEILAPFLGEGLHFGEWWGEGIQRGYDQLGKRFSLFNTKRWMELDFPDYIRDLNLRVVPTLMTWDGKDIGYAVEESLNKLRFEGSAAAPGYRNPEGVVAYFTAANTPFKFLLEHPDTPKSLVSTSATSHDG